MFIVSDVSMEGLLNGISAVYAGEEECVPLHSYGPHVRSYYLMHVVLSGRGIFRIHEKKYALSRGDVFFIRPNELAYYCADEKDPWHYLWLGLAGTDAGGIFDAIAPGQDTLHLKSTDILFPLLSDFVRRPAARSAAERYAHCAALYTILSHLAENAPEKTHRPSSRIYAEEAALYIHSNFFRRISVAELADYISIDRSYLCSVFRRYMGMSPQKYIIEVKMKNAAELLKRSDFSVTQVASSVGYDDPLLFSRIFRSRYGVSPREYRK